MLFIKNPPGGKCTEEWRIYTVLYTTVYKLLSAPVQHIRHKIGFQK